MVAHLAVSTRLVGLCAKGPLRVCAKDVPIPYAAALETAALPNEEDLLAAARALVRRER